MKRALYLLMTVTLVAVFSVANAQNVQCYGYARTCFNGESWQNKFVAFNTGQPGEVQAVSETLPEIWAATYLDGYVWYVTMMTRSLCKAPFDEETQTMGASETVVAQLEPYNLIVDMAYNPMDGMMYYLCQDSQYNSYLKCSSLANPSAVETIGTFSVKLWTLAINSQGQAYGVAYEGGNLYQVNLADATVTLVGPTGKEVWYTQSMAFDWETDELYWAHFATASDHGLYQVNTQTGAATALGTIGQGTQLTGLFMVSENATPEPEIISEIYVEGFTAPVWGEHPDFDVNVASDAHCSIVEVNWVWEHEGTVSDLTAEDVFDQEDGAYYMGVLFLPEEGYVFAEEMTVFFNGDATVFDTQNSMVNTATGKFQAWTVGFSVADPTFIAEQTLNDWESLEGQTVSIYDMTGRLVFQGCYGGRCCFEGLKPGVYVVNTARRSFKLMVE